MPNLILPDEASRFLREHLGTDWTIEPLPGDASVRRYFRVRRPDGSSVMLAYYPEEVRGQLDRALKTYAAVRPHAPVPAVSHYSSYAVLQDDVGDQTLFDLLHQDRQAGIRRYGEAVQLLVTFQRTGDAAINPPFTAASFRTELEMTREFYVEKLMGMPAWEAERMVPLLRILCEKVSEHPYVICHRDFHGQNIHILNDNLFVIDYQDMRMGPDTYDLASLLRDRGVARILGDAMELELVDEYRRLTGSDRGVRHRYFETLLQRSLKILGTFAKQALVRGRLHYLEFIPPTLDSIRRCLQQLAHFGPLEHLFPMQFEVEAVRRRLEVDGQTQADAPPR